MYALTIFYASLIISFFLLFSLCFPYVLTLFNSMHNGMTYQISQ